LTHSVTELHYQGRIQDFKVEGRGADLKKLRRAEGGAKIFGVFRVKNHDCMPKNHIFSNFRGARAGCAPPDYYVTLNRGCRDDLRMWYGFLDQWTGISFFIDDNIVSAAKFDLNTDASSAIGFGGYFRNKWFQGWFRFGL
jgi:hypothetical protein